MHSIVRVSYLMLQLVLSCITDGQDYVNDQDFATVFKMSRQEFQQLPKWKQKRAKQDAGLF